MTKQEKLTALDTKILDKMIDILDSKDGLQELSLLSVPVNYLKANAVVSEKPKSSVEEDMKKRLEIAEKRRKVNKPK
jgi:hypothetical protein